MNYFQKLKMMTLNAIVRYSRDRFAEAYLGIGMNTDTNQSLEILRCYKFY